jgi:hypothetical protein
MQETLLDKLVFCAIIGPAPQFARLIPSEDE